jgi:GPH family glycoside/pentoside/hexuronide:cation symporter
VSISRAARPPEAASVPAQSLPLGWPAILAYSLPGAGAGFLFTLMTVLFLKYGTDVLLVSSFALGNILLGCKVWAAVADPLAGFLSDRTRSRFGRRKPWVLASALPIALFSLMLWAPPVSLSETGLVAWLTVAAFGFYTAFTLFEVPNLSLGAQLTYDARLRGRIFGTRQLVRGVGLFGAFAVGASALEEIGGAREAARVIVLSAGIFTALSIALSVFATPPEVASGSDARPEHPLRALRDVWSNRHARILLTVYFIEMFGLGAVGTLVPYLMSYVIEMPERMAEMLLVYVLPTLVSIPLWVWLGNRFEKRDVWLTAMVMSAVGFALLLFLSKDDWILMAVSSLLAGTAMGCGQSLGVALKAEIIDADELATGERKDGSYFAAWSFVSKVGGALMIWVVGVALAWSGYAPPLPIGEGGALVEQPQTELVKTTLRVLVGGLPALGFGIGALIFRKFSLTSAEHARIRAALDPRAVAER